MKYAKLMLIADLTLPILLVAQGTSCSNAIPLTLDGVLRSYSTSSSTGGGNGICSSSGNTPITWFYFTTDASAQCPLINVTAPTNTSCEVALYTACGNNNDIPASGMCFTDGGGLWAPSETFTVSPNTQYYLKVKTETTGTITISGQPYTPSNTTCYGALPIGDTAKFANNACHKPGTGVTKEQLCATSLENTAFFRYYVAETGVSIININDISCDNIGNANSNGFQVGFFTGECSSLSFRNCTQTFGSTVQATTPSLPAGTKVTVAVDGTGGANCQFRITAFNAYEVLSSGFKNFSVWNKPASNIIKWTINQETGAYYEIERSDAGLNFVVIGKVPATSSANGNYSFEDISPAQYSFYRIKQMRPNGKILMSETLQVSRDDLPQFRTTIVNPVINNLNLKIESRYKGSLEYIVTNLYGQTFLKGTIDCTKGIIWFNKNISVLPQGKYLFTIAAKDQKSTNAFIKIN